jgi:hypothetical protein
MTRNLVCSSLTALAVVSLCGAQGHGAQNRSVKPLTICELFNKLRSHKNKTITITGILFESGSYMLGQTGCPKKFVTDGYTWPTTVILDSTLAIEDAPFRTDQNSMEKLGEASLNQPKGSELWVTVTGQLRLKKRYMLGHTHYGVLGAGYGPPGASPALLLVKTIDEIVVKKPPQ